MPFWFRKHKGHDLPCDVKVMTSQSYHFDFFLRKFWKFESLKFSEFFLFFGKFEIYWNFRKFWNFELFWILPRVPYYCASLRSRIPSVSLYWFPVASFPVLIILSIRAMDLESKYCYFYHNWDFILYYDSLLFIMFR